MTTLFVVSHTHWDREWYRSAESFRVGLVSLIDELMAGSGPFLLDGQAILLHDFEDWRPEQVPYLRTRLLGGEVEAGPWFVLADNLIPSGEAIVRNLLQGRRSAAHYGATSPPVLYCPDTFGHPSAGPAIAAGFGLPLAIVLRGYGGRGWPAGDAARWRADSGEEVQLYHLPASGYEHGANLPATPDESRDRWEEIAASLGSRATLPSLLLLNGADHHAPQRALDAALALGRQVLPASRIRRSTLRDWVSARVDEGAAVSLPAVHGELRASPSFVWSLQGTFGTRAAQKRDNAALERLLTREVEPWVALAWWTAGTDLQFAVSGLWRLALENHPHDTLCGCSSDDVAMAMDDRTRRARVAALDLRRTALHAVVGLDADDSRAAFTGHARSMLLSNPVPRVRTGVVEVEVEVPLARVPVGPGSADRQSPARNAGPIAIGEPALPAQRLTAQRAFARHDAPHHYPVASLVRRERMLVWVEALPPMGVAVLSLSERRRYARSAEAVSADGGIVDNGRIRVWCDEARRVCCSVGDTVYEDLLGFETVGDAGDLYTHSPIPGTHREGAVTSWRVTMRGPLRAELSLTCRVPVAPRTVATAAGPALARRPLVHRVHVRIQLDAGASWFRVLAGGENRAEDQRLRAVFRTGCASPTHFADAAFGVVERRSSQEEPQAGDVERVPNSAPLHRHVSLFSSAMARGATIISDGMAEYEATPAGEVAITLVRSVGDLSRATLAERPGHAGWPMPTPGAQCVGPWAAVFAFLPHGVSKTEALAVIARACDDVLVPPRGLTIVQHPAAAFPGLELEGDLWFLACKQGESGASLVVRCLNPGGRTVTGAWRTRGLTAAFLARLDETPLGALAVHDDRVRFEVPPHAVSTILLSRGAGPTS